MTCAEDVAGGRLLYQSGGRSFTGAFSRPRGNGPFPAALVLHGGGGFRPADQGTYASWLADQGYVALAPDYFSPIGVTGQTFGVTFYVQHTDEVREDLSRGIDCLKSLAYVDPSRVAVVGFSLGGYYALVLGTRLDVKAVVSYYPAVCGAPVNGCPARYPLGDVLTQVRTPVLLLQGDADALVKPDHVRATQDFLVAAGKPSELVVYPKLGHSFNFPGPTFDAAATADARSRTLRALAAALR